jgi:beta-glucuronidase
MYWTLQEFRIRPDWAGGNPRPTPPLHQKGLIAFDGRLKPAFADVQRSYAATRQYGG